MKQTTIQFSFDDGKLEAIRLYLQGKDAELDSELQGFMESLYKRNALLTVFGRRNICYSTNNYRIQLFIFNFYFIAGTEVDTDYVCSKRL